MMPKLSLYRKLSSRVSSQTKSTELGEDAYVIAREGFALEQDLVPTVDIWTVEGRHQQMEVCCQSLHDSNFGLLCPYKRGHQLGCSVISM
jgi:hypothetical protein